MAAKNVAKIFENPIGSPTQSPGHAEKLATFQATSQHIPPLKKPSKGPMV
jgi:hypothetical protein